MPVWVSVIEAWQPCFCSLMLAAILRVCCVPLEMDPRE